MKRYSFGKNLRLKTNEQFKAVLRHKCSAGNGLVKVYVAGNNCEHPRLGVSVSKKYGPAVIRNRIKRLSREVFRLQQYNIAANYDYLLIFSSKMTKKTKSDDRNLQAGVTLEELTEMFLELSEKALAKLKVR